MMLYYVIVKSVVLVSFLGMAALERRDLSCMYLAHHELESVMMMIIIIIIV